VFNINRFLIMDQLIKIAKLTLESLVQIWPYVIITIPISVIVNVSGASKYISKALNKKVLLSILLATVVGAFSPFCSCGVIPLIASLLIGGVPLAPVMSFWIASPSMDPEIFFLSVATIGWKLSLWRLVATFILSLSAGYITHLAIQKGFLGKELLRTNSSTSNVSIKMVWQGLISLLKLIPNLFSSPKGHLTRLVGVRNTGENTGINCCVNNSSHIEDKVKTAPNTCCSEGKKEVTPKQNVYKKVLQETWKASFMVVKFMSLAFIISAVVKLYIPHDAVSQMMGSSNPFAVVIATLIGAVTYSSNLAALPLVSGLLTVGMSQASALAFLIAGPITAVPAMVAVWGIANRRVFALYISFSILGAIVFGFLYLIFN